jgi:hypothetical protein
MVFGPLSLLEPGPRVDVGGVVAPMPALAGMVLEKLLTDRTGEKGDRDLLVVAGLLSLASEDDMARVIERHRSLPPEARHAVRANLSTLSLLPARAQMPDPLPVRARIAALLAELEGS